MITKRKKPDTLTPKASIQAPLRGATVRDRRPASAPSRGGSKRRRSDRRREYLRGRTGSPRAHVGIFETLLHSVLSFAGAALAVSCVASLAGNVMLESARRGTIENQGRLRAETAGREDLKSRLAALASTDAVDRWATEHGYLSADDALPTAAKAELAPKAPNSRRGRSLVARR